MPLKENRGLEQLWILLCKCFRAEHDERIEELKKNINHVKSLQVSGTNT